jgi:hypothetical protein
MWPFKRKSIVDADTAEWRADNFAWLAASFGGNSSLAATTLVLPKPGLFPSEGHDKVVRIFEWIKQYCGMENWPVELVPDHNPAAIRSSPLSLSAPVHGKHAQGTFSIAGGTVQISYAPSLLGRWGAGSQLPHIARRSRYDRTRCCELRQGWRDDGDHETTKIQQRALDLLGIKI